MLTILYDAIYKQDKGYSNSEGDDRESGKSAIGINERGKFVRVSKEVRHRAIVGVTGAGKTTLAQTLKEIDIHRKRKVVEIEPSLEAKCEGIFMNLPNSNPEMVKILQRDFDLEPKPFKTIAYTPPTQQYIQFIQEYPEMSGYFKPIRFTEYEIKQVLTKILPGGPIERMLLKTYLDRFSEDTLDDLVDHLQNASEVPGYMKSTASKILYLTNLGIISDKGVSLKRILTGNHASIITFAFVEDPLDRFMCSLIYLTAIYETWKEIPHSRILSFYVADANLFAPSRNKDLLDSLSRYQQRARAQLQIYSRISRAQRLAWTLDFQSWQDIDDVVKEQMTERFFKRTWSEEVARMLGLEQSKLRRLGKPYAYFHNMRYLQKIKIRPPMSRKAKEGQFTPVDFVKELRRFEYEEATFDI